MPSPKSLAPEELGRLLASRKKPLVIDVRERDEFAAGSIRCSVNIPLGTVIAGVLDGRLPKDRLIVTVCERGSERSPRAARELALRGFNAALLLGGLRAWGHGGRKKASGRKRG